MKKQKQNGVFAYVQLMILLTRGQVVPVIVTASEKAVIEPTVFTISFTHNLTKAPVVISPAVDVSPAKDRYNRFDVDTEIFDDLDNGFYTYQVTDQDGSVLEMGKAKLEGEKPVVTQYQDTPTAYKTYGE